MSSERRGSGEAEENDATAVEQRQRFEQREAKPLEGCGEAGWSGTAAKRVRRSRVERYGGEAEKKEGGENRLTKAKYLEVDLSICVSAGETLVKLKDILKERRAHEPPSAGA